MTYPEWFEAVQAKYGMRVNEEAARHLYDSGLSVYDAVQRLMRAA